MDSLLGSFGLSAGCVLCAAFLVLRARKFIQGYYFDVSFKPSRSFKGSVAIVTGANSGLGKATAELLAQHGVRVIMACRSTTRGEAAAREIRARVPGSELEVHQLDVSSVSSVQRFADRISQTEPRLDFLVNNAGISQAPDGVPAECPDTGVCVVFQTNHLGHAHLTQRLLPLLEATAAQGDYRCPVRVVSVSSGAHTRAGIGGSLEEVNAAAADTIIGGKYGQSKLAQIMWTKELQRRLDSSGTDNSVCCVAVTPGFARTSVMGSAGTALKLWQRAAIGLLWPLLLLVSRSGKQGAQVIVMGCLGDDVRGGCYYSNCLEKPTQGRGSVSNNPEACRALWDLTAELLAPAASKSSSAGM